MLPDGALGVGVGTSYVPVFVLNAALRFFSLFRPSLVDILDNIATINRELERVGEKKNELFAQGDEATVRQLQEDTDLISVCCT